MMRKVALSFMAAALVVGAASGKTYSDKTFLMPRSQLSNLPLEYATWHKALHRKSDSKYNGTIQVVPFYQESEDKTDVGRYFGFFWQADPANNITAGIVNEVGVSPGGPAEKRIFKPEDVIHYYNFDYAAVPPRQGTLTANYSFRPDQRVYGVRLSYHQDLDRILDGLFLRINAPIVEVRNDMNIKSLIPEVKQRLPIGNAIPAQGKEYSFLDYLSGNIENFDGDNLQQRLKYAKITSGSHSESGIADIETTLGYTFWHKGRYRAALMGSIIIPTGNTVNGQYVFEPVYGNGDHWGLTLALDKSIVLWKRKNKFVELSFVAKYKYLFESTEKRTLGYMLPQVVRVPAGYYALGGKDDEIGVFPLANILTQDLRVAPGSQYESMINLSFVVKKFIFDIGYDFYAKEKEHIDLKYVWQNDTYGLANNNYRTNLVFDINNNNHVRSRINEENLDFDSVTTPDQITHKVYAAFGYECDKWKYPVMVGLGGSYEFSKNNSALENWALWLKGAVSW